MNEKEVREGSFAMRLYIYALFSRIFGQEPDNALLEELTGETTRACLLMLDDGQNGKLAQGASFLARIAQERHAGNAVFLDDAKREYTRLFIGPAELPAPPWESVYRDKQGLLFQKTTLKVREFYREFQLAVKTYPHEADDHLAYELDFMANLAKQSLLAYQMDARSNLARLLHGQRDFLEQHLLVWIPQFLEHMKDAPSRILYPQLCVIFNAFLQEDKHQIRILEGLIS